MKLFEVRCYVFREQFVRRFVRANDAQEAERKFDEWFVPLTSDEVEEEIISVRTEFGSTDADESDESEVEDAWVIE